MELRGQAISTTRNYVNAVEELEKVLGKPHKVAISNHRILDITQQNVVFSYKDYADKAKKKEMILSGPEFVRRFALHILPSGYQRIRHFGFLSNANKTRLLPLARAALHQPQKTKSTPKERKEAAIQRLFPCGNPDKCPHCNSGTYHIVETLHPTRPPPTAPNTQNRPS